MNVPYGHKLNLMGLDELGWLVPIVRYQCLVLLVHLIGCDGARSLSRMRRTGNLEIKRHRANKWHEKRCFKTEDCDRCHSQWATTDVGSEKHGGL